VWEAELGDGPLGIAWAQASLSLDENPSTAALAVLAFARARTVPRADALLQRLSAAETNVDAVVVTGMRHKLRAAVNLARGRPDLAVEDLVGLGSYEVGGVANMVALRGDLAELGVFHLRGLAFLSLKQGKKAAAEFQKILDNQHISPLSPYVALAPLHLGRALGLAGDLQAARAAYEQFLDRWRDADAEVRLVSQATREYEKLSAGSRPATAK
jgi:tetratricopeptide (TPR) repeat protein